MRSLLSAVITACFIGTSDAFAPLNSRSRPETTQLKAAVDVVLFGVGDLRVDDHVGLQRALEEQDSTILPMVVLDPEILSNIPGVTAHTHDTAHLLASALTDLQEQLKDMFQLPLVVEQGSVKQALERVQGEEIRVHVCDLGVVDNEMGYGGMAQLKDLDGFEIMAWDQNLRSSPWDNVQSLPDSYPAYKAKFLDEKPADPLDISSQDASSRAAVKESSAIPSADELESLLAKHLNLDQARVETQIATGLYATHWGGLPADTIKSNYVLKAIECYTNCDEDDDLWFQQFADTFASKRTPTSLEHASMAWQLKDKPNWLPGETFVRALAAPLLFGTVSPRRVWKLAGEPKWGFTSPLKQLTEGREWHRLLAARPQEVEGDTVYKYWRYHGFLCRYAQTDLTDNSKSDNPDGVLLVHGFGASGAQWNKAMTELSQQDLGGCCRQGLAPDLLGFGEAEKPALSYTGYLWDSFIMEFVKEVAVPKHGWKSFVVGGNSIGGFTAISLAASDTSTPSDQPQVTSSGAPGTNLCTGLVLMNSAGPVFSEEEISKVTDSADKKLLSSVAQMTITGGLPPCSPPPRPVGRAFGNALLSYLRPRIQDICQNLYPTNPAAVDEALCAGIRRDSLDPGAIYVMMAGAKLPKPRTANELLGADFGGPPQDDTHESPESFFAGPVLVAQGVLDPLNDSQDRMEKFGALRDGIRMDPIQAGHCPHDELPDQVARSIAQWMLQTQPAATLVRRGSSSNVSV